MFFLSVQYVQQVLGFGPLASGFAFLPLTVGIFAVSRFTPRLVARYGPVRLQLVGLLGLFASFVWISSAGAGDTYADGDLRPDAPQRRRRRAWPSCRPRVLILGDVEPEHAGAASGLMQTMQQLGGAVGLAVIASVYAAGAVPGEFLPGAQEAFLTSALLTLLAAVAVLTLVRRPVRVG